MKGWVKLHRKIQENDFWTCEKFTRGQAWVDLILLCNHQDSFYYKRGVKIDVGRGQLGRSVVELSDRWKWSRSKVNKFLKDLEKEQQIIQQKTNITQLVTLINYDEFQEKEQQTVQQKSSRRAAEVQQKDTYNNDNNDNNEKKNIKAFDFLEIKKELLAEINLMHLSSILQKGVDANGGNFKMFPDAIGRIKMQFNNFMLVLKDRDMSFKDINHIKNYFRIFLEKYWNINDANSIIFKMNKEFKKKNYAK